MSSRYLSPLLRFEHRYASGSSLIEMVPMLMVVIPSLLFMVSLASLAAGYVTLNLACQSAAREAGSASNMQQAQKAVTSIEDKLLNHGPFTGFGGISNGELKLAIQQARNGENHFSDFVAGNAIAPNEYIYRCRVSGKCNIKPLFWPVSLSNLECFGVSVIEHPEGLGAPI